jgi:hypothetical protein
MTALLQIKTSKEESLHPNDWFPWINCKSIDETVMLAAHRFIRMRGGLGDEPLTLYTYIHWPGMSKGPNGSHPSAVV